MGKTDFKSTEVILTGKEWNSNCHIKFSTSEVSDAFVSFGKSSMCCLKGACCHHQIISVLNLTVN